MLFIAREGQVIEEIECEGEKEVEELGEKVELALRSF